MTSEREIKNWSFAILISLSLWGVFHPAINLIVFHLNLNEFLLECKEQRNHDKECQAGCILEEMMPERSETIPGKTTSFIYFFPGLFFQNHQLTPTALLNETLTVNLVSHYLLLYSPPLLRMHLPPPKSY